MSRTGTLILAPVCFLRPSAFPALLFLSRLPLTFGKRCSLSHYRQMRATRTCLTVLGPHKRCHFWRFSQQPTRMESWLSYCRLAESHYRQRNEGCVVAQCPERGDLVLFLVSTCHLCLSACSTHHHCGAILYCWFRHSVGMAGWSVGSHLCLDHTCSPKKERENRILRRIRKIVLKEQKRC